ncbi:MAG: 4-hydroxy-tetrahydrodipicolinate reductase [Candidatus Eisenbacteria bacterium]
MTPTIRVAIAGAAGRMGQELARAVAGDGGLVLEGVLERPGHPWLGRLLEGVPITAEPHAVLARSRVLLDFTVPPATRVLAEAAAQAGAAILCGTTALSPQDRAALERAGARVAVLQAPNLSLGVALLTRLARQAAAALPNHDIEIVEMHHRRKEDAPSGTALVLAEAIESARPGLTRVAGRTGHTGARGASEIGIHALRGGDVAGDHEVIFAGAGERIILAHRAESRAAFVAGALRAIHFLAARPAGCYSIDDVLGTRG